MDKTDFFFFNHVSNLESKRVLILKTTLFLNFMPSITYITLTGNTLILKRKINERLIRSEVKLGRFLLLLTQLRAQIFIHYLCPFLLIQGYTRLSLGKGWTSPWTGCQAIAEPLIYKQPHTLTPRSVLNHQ